MFFKTLILSEAKDLDKIIPEIFPFFVLGFYNSIFDPFA